MCIIIRRDDPVSPRWQSKPHFGVADKICRQDGFTLTEVLVSLCIVVLVMHGVWQWGTVMLRTSESMAQNQQAVYLAQQVLNGMVPQLPDGWDITVQSEQNGKLLYETTVVIKAEHRQWQFYYAGPEEVQYADV